MNSIGWFGSDNRRSSGSSTGTKCFASAAYSSAGNCERMMLRGLVEVNGIVVPYRKLGTKLKATPSFVVLNGVVVPYARPSARR